MSARQRFRSDCAVVQPDQRFFSSQNHLWSPGSPCKRHLRVWNGRACQKSHVYLKRFVTVIFTCLPCVNIDRSPEEDFLQTYYHCLVHISWGNESLVNDTSRMSYHGMLSSPDVFGTSKTPYLLIDDGKLSGVSIRRRLLFGQFQSSHVSVGSTMQPRIDGIKWISREVLV